METRDSSVVLIGRPNVGKSTLFNRIAGWRRAIVTPVPGTTRDLITERVSWRGVGFRLVDTGGMFGASEDPLHRQVVEKGMEALGAAAVVVLMVDARDGRVPGDEEVATAARRVGVPVIVAINKVDDRRGRERAGEFYQLGFDTVVEIAAEHGQGVGDLLDAVVAALPAPQPAASRADVRLEAGAVDVQECALLRPQTEIQVAILGRPNVGKSSLLNRLLREDRVLVSDMPGTTRDTVDATVRWRRRLFRIVDTAGIRRPGRVAEAGQVEAVSVVLARRALERADVVVVVLDAAEGVTEQDAAIAGEADRAGRSLILAANKWDLTKSRGAGFAREFDANVRDRLKFADYAPIVHLSALTGERTGRLLEMIDRVATARAVRVPTGELNRFVETITAAHPPVSPGRQAVRVLYVAQVAAAPPRFVFFTNVATRFHFSYQRYLENRLRERFGFLGTPIRIEVRTRSRRHA